MLSLLISRVGRRAVVVAGAVAVVSTVACGDDVTAPKSAAVIPSASSAIDIGNPLPALMPPVADGVITTGEYPTDQSFTMPVKLPGQVLGFGSVATVYVTHDQTYLYLAVTFDRKSPFRSTDHVSFEWDLDHDGDSENGDDIVGLHAFASGAWDYYRYNGGMYNKSDNADGGTNDAIGAFGVVGTTGVFEIRKELNSGDHLHDMGVYFATGAKLLGMRTMIALESAGRPELGSLVRSWSPSQTGYCELMMGKKFTTFECP